MGVNRDLRDDDDFVDYSSSDERTVDGIGMAQLTDPSGGSKAYLIALAGNRVGQMVPMDRELVIGRARSAGFRVEDPGVSKHHVRLIQLGTGEILAQDLGSRNGTYVSGTRIDKCVLKDGDKIYMGSTTILKFSLADSIEESFQQQMYDAALRDALTGLFNRRHLMEQLETEVSFALRHGVPLSVIMLDIDHFKQVNDSFGHRAGDSVLRGFSDRLTAVVRKEDIAARYGGEEFTVVCRSTRTSVAGQIADRLRLLVESSSLVPNDPQYQVTVSAGVASLPDPAFNGSTGLLEAADHALYEAKAAGRNRVRLYDPRRGKRRSKSNV